ncbi:dexamethasone-induced protein isoform X1 [Corapipo altera]|uniref:dexamethasone-induced protein isoform X1 n=1 Tax=Corapipo altera TaxID=415028 RepID=UPI000FD69298|nr:dexamethasone-induced protein isoform X1 [Corapipo altera]
MPSLRPGSSCAASSLPNDTPPSRCRGQRGSRDPLPPGRPAETSPGKFIKHLTWIMTRVMDQVLERNCALKCGDGNKDKRQQEELPSDLVSCDFSSRSLPLEGALTAVTHAPCWASMGNSGVDCMKNKINYLPL